MVKLTNRPLILSLKMEQAASEYFNQLRRSHFPSHINFLDAHLTLFHALPELSEISALLDTIVGQHRPFNLRAERIMPLGYGTAIKIHSNKLIQLRQLLKQQWKNILSAQDEQGFRPHITIQNKVSPMLAKALQNTLSADFIPFEFSAVGLSVSRYNGGPWEKVKDFDFKDGDY